MEIVRVVEEYDAVDVPCWYHHWHSLRRFVGRPSIFDDAAPSPMEELSDGDSVRAVEPNITATVLAVGDLEELASISATLTVRRSGSLL